MPPPHPIYSVQMFNDDIDVNVLHRYYLIIQHLLYGRYDGNKREATVGC
jgi:hypothetical protein